MLYRLINLLKRQLLIRLVNQHDKHLLVAGLQKVLQRTALGTIGLPKPSFQQVSHDGMLKLSLGNSKAHTDGCGRQALRWGNCI